MEKSNAYSYKNLIVWQRAMDLVMAAYTLSDTFPQTEKYGLVTQIRRAAISIPANIAEGSRRSTKKDYRQFLIIAYASGTELETHIEIAKRLKLGKAVDYEKVNLLLDEVMRMLNKMTHSSY